MLVLLPPSEGKAAGRRGRPLDLEQLSFPELHGTRVAVLDALIDNSRGPDALDVLGAPKGAADAVAGNLELRTAPAMRVSQLYTGVLYDALDLGSLDAAAKRRASRWLVVISALFGALRPTDRVPPYRLSMGVDLPGIGKLASMWQEPLARVLPAVAGDGVVVDLRSAAYVAAWRPTGDVAERTVNVHVVRDEPGGRTAVSHMAKHTRGLVARYLLESGAGPATPDDLAAALAERFVVDLHAGRPGKPRRLDIVEP